MFTVRFENYNNDNDKFFEDKYFNSLEELGDYLINENNKRDTTSKSSKYWKSPIGTMLEKDGTVKGWYRTSVTNGRYELWLKKITLDNGVVVFEESHYCSPKFYNFLNKVNSKICAKETYGDF